MIKFIKPRCRTLVGLAVFALILAVLPAYVSGYTVNGPSEAPTLLLGDFAVVNHAAFDVNLPYSAITLANLGAPKPGDLVLFRVPNRDALGLKVVVGVPGDVVAMRENQLYLNQRAVPLQPLPREGFDWVPKEHAIGANVARETLETSRFSHEITYTPGLSPLRSFAPVTVPKDCYFLLGDHRDNSNDSRIFGAVARDSILGKVVFVWRSPRVSRK